MIDYFVEQDLVQLEKAKGFRVGAKCPKCNKGTLQNTDKREIGERRETEFFECDYCKSQFQSFRAEV